MSTSSPWAFSGNSDSKESACSAGDPGLIPELRRFPIEWNGNPLQYSCLENPMDRGAWWVTVHGVAKSRIWLSDQQGGITRGPWQGGAGWPPPTCKTTDQDSILWKSPMWKRNGWEQNQNWARKGKQRWCKQKVKKKWRRGIESGNFRKQVLIFHRFRLASFNMYTGLLNWKSIPYVFFFFSSYFRGRNFL